MSAMRNVRLGLTFASALVACTPAGAQQQQRPPNILFIMGDDVGWFNIGAYHRG
jgi:arylsulfatase